MLLQGLYKYSQTLAIPPDFYQQTSVRYVVKIDIHGRCQGILDTATPEEKRGKKRLVPDCNRSSGDRPILFADHVEYTFGISRPEKSQEAALRRHALYRTLVRACAAASNEMAVQAVFQFLEMLQPGQPPCALPEMFDANEKMTFEVQLDDLSSIYPVQLPAVQTFWAEYMRRGEVAPSTECLMCGEMRPPLATLPVQIHGIPGGQATGMALISANANAFESYGLKQSRVAPICETCGRAVCLALNTLLSQRETHLTGRSLVYAFWTSEPTEFQFGSAVMDADPTEVRAFLTSPWKGRQQSIETGRFYAATLAANNARIVLRDWTETTLESVREHLSRYFRLQYLVDAFGEPRWYPLWQLFKATTRSESHDGSVLPIEHALLHFAFQGGSLPLWLLSQVLRSMRSEQTGKQAAKADRQSAQAALLKMILLSQANLSWLGKKERSDKEKEQTMVELDLTCADRAYLCGRLFAELEEIEALAMGKISSTIVDRYFGTASSAPATVFAKLLRHAQPHLAKLSASDARRGAFFRLDNQLQDILMQFEEKTFPSTLSLLEQGRFALGYYQQKAANRQAARAGAERKAARQLDETPHHEENTSTSV